MPAEINVTSQQIAHSESILLDEGECFDEERREFIKNFDTLDLQAVPGSGKTTALLAKLLILEDHLPLNDGGVLVISHTNSAVDEIKDEISAYCPKLFNYPNFVGTIQSFVNKFLAIPFAGNFLNTRISIIDTDTYQEALWRRFSNAYYWSKRYERPGTWLFKRNIKRAEKEAKRLQLKPKERCNELIEEKVKDLYYDFDDEKVKFFRNDEVLLKTKSNSKYKGFKKCINEVLSEGIISYRYAYILAKDYCKKYPNIINLLQQRFRYIFVDEMQDMDKLQYKLLEKIFYQEGKSKSIFQRVGDKNQSIYNGNIIEDEIWEDRETVLTLSGSHRLSENNATVVNNFAINCTKEFEISGLNDGEIPPHIFVYEQSKINNVIPKYAEIIKTYQAKGLIPKNSKYPFKAVAWNTEWSNEQDTKNSEKVRLVDYYPSFSKEKATPKNQYINLKSYLFFYDTGKQTLAAIRKNILNALLRILKLENIRDENSRNFTKRRLMKFLRENHPEEYEQIKLNIYNWSIEVIKGNQYSMLKSIRSYLPSFLKIFESKINSSNSFIESDELRNIDDTTDNENKDSNIISFDKLNIELESVHSVKGRTHTATLYLETYYRKEYESERLCNQILGKRFPDSEDRTYHQHSALVSYVGFSRPTHLLCLAVDKDRFEEHLSGLDENIWEVVEVD